jgi:Ca2+/Na+ antiporter
VIDQLARTKPWVRLFAVLMFLGAGSLLLIAAGMLVVGGIGATKSSGPWAGMSGAMPIAFAMVYVVLALKLWKYASRIGQLVHTGSDMDLEGALNEQRAFWKFAGILMIVMIALYLVAIIVAVVTTMGMAAHLKPANL